MLTYTPTAPPGALPPPGLPGWVLTSPLPRVVPMDPFETEHRVFASHLARLLATHEGDYAVVYGERLIGVCTTLESAVELGWTETRSRSFLVRRITEEPAVVLLPARVA